MAIIGRINKSQLKFVVLCLTLPIISLSIPIISIIFILVVPLIIRTLGYLRIPRYIVKSQIILISIISLLLFTIFNYYQVYLHGFDSDQSATKIILTILVINILFLISISLDFKKMPFFPFNIVIVNVLLFTGGILWVFLSVAKNTGWSFSIGTFLIQNRAAPSFWTSDIEPINGPSLDIFSYLGLSLVGTFIVGLSSFDLSVKKTKLRELILFTAIFCLVCMSLYSSIALAARTPILVFLGSVIATVIFCNSSKQSRKSITITNIRLIVYCLIGIIFLLFGELLVQKLFDWTNVLLDIGIGNRLISSGLDTPRYEVWLAAIDQMWDFPWGGRNMLLRETYAHNIWLDQLYDAGILPMFLLLTFHIVQIPILFRFFRLKLPLIVHVFVLCTLIAFMAAFLQAPVIQASVIYFAMSCFFFGSVARFTSDIKRLP